MNTDPAQLKQKAKAKEEENFRFRRFLKCHRDLSGEEVDQLVAEISARVWRRIDCTTCGNCCRSMAPTFSPDDVDRLARHLGLPGSDLVSQYLKRNEDPNGLPWIMRQYACPFLKDNRCTVYDGRPDNCRDYPYLDRPEFTSRTFSMMARLSVCPAVYEVWEGLKRETGFRGPGRPRGRMPWDEE